MFVSLRSNTQIKSSAVQKLESLLLENFLSRELGINLSIKNERVMAHLLIPSYIGGWDAFKARQSYAHKFKIVTFFLEIVRLR